MKKKIYIFLLAAFIILTLVLFFSLINWNSVQDKQENYSVHKGITATVFWVGEDATEENGFIDNHASAWDSSWEQSFGGVDDPQKRNGFWPEGFKPEENPFYAALPYNDFTPGGERKSEAYEVVYWSEDKDWGERESMLKNKWIKIVKDGKEAYAQWEDVGPFGEDDKSYVFGQDLPRSGVNENAGIDVSPAVRDYLGLSGINKVDWEFIDEKNVPDGPWKDIVTDSQINWR